MYQNAKLPAYGTANTELPEGGCCDHIIIAETHSLVHVFFIIISIISNLTGCF